MIAIDRKHLFDYFAYMEIYLEADRVLLRPFRFSDEEVLFELDSDPEVMKYISLGKPTARAAIRPMIERIQSMNSRFNEQLGTWIAECKKTKNFLGWFHLRPDKQEPENLKRLEIGYRLMRKHWGKGYATEVSRALVQKAFAELDAEVVFALTMKENLASQAVMKKIGMIYHREYFYDQPPSFSGNVVEYHLIR